jgi:hypothetical protein
MVLDATKALDWNPSGNSSVCTSGTTVGVLMTKPR